MAAGSSNSPTKTGERIRLSPFTQSDISLIIDWMGDADQRDLTLWAGANYTAPITRDQVEIFLGKLGPERDFFFLIELEQEKSWIPAGVMLLTADRKHEGIARIGHVLIGSKEYRNRGAATAAVLEVLRIGFGEKKFHKITLGVFPDNIPALSCYRKLGFHQDGVLREQQCIEGVWTDLIEMSMLSGEFPMSGDTHSGKERNRLEIETPKLLLRVFDEADTFGELPQTLEFYRRNKEFHRRWSPFRGEAFYTAAGQEEHLRAGIKMLQQRTGVRFWIYFRSEGAGESFPLIGNMSLTNIVRGHFHSAFLGYQLDKEYVGKGFGTDAVRALVTYGFSEMGLHRIEANIMPENIPSRRLAEKIGFQQEGLARKYLQIQGRWEDHFHYSLISEEFMEGNDEQSLPLE